jgi:creatinine amidohydrolase
MKRQSVFIAEMTNPEVERFLREHDTVIIPVGSTEQHGPAGPTSTDVLIPVEIARRTAGGIGALVAPALSYGLSYPHQGFASAFSLRIPTFMAVIEDLCLSFAASGFRRIIFLNGHFDNTYPIAYACANAAGRLPKGCRAFPVTYFEGIPPQEAARFMGGEKGLHANAAEISAVLAIDPGLVDMEAANIEVPHFPATKTGSPGIHTAFFLTQPGSVWRITESGTWGDAAKATEQMGREFLEAAVRATVAVIEDIEMTFKHLPKRGE